MKYTYFYITISLLFLFSCEQKNKTVYSDLGYEEVKDVAEKYNIGFCIVLADNDCNACNEYTNSLKGTFNKLNEKTVFNIIYTNQIENEWYKYWLYSPATPTTCIFNAKGDLVNVISGSSKKTFQCIEKSIDGNYECSDFFESSIIPIDDKKNIIPILNKVLKCKQSFDKGEDITIPLEQTLNIAWYPYNVYLHYLNENRKGNAENAKHIAKQLLTFEKNPYAKFLYSKIFTEAGTTLTDPDHDKITQ